MGRVYNALLAKALGLPVENSKMKVVLKRFENPDEVTHFEKGKFETVELGGMTIGRATYQPGWKWSRDVGARLGRTSAM